MIWYKKVLHTVNVPKHICHHCLGKEHTHKHRMVVGTMVMVIGVGIAQAGHHVEPYIISFTMDLTGYAVHGLGLAPFVEKLLETFGGD